MLDFYINEKSNKLDNNIEDEMNKYIFDSKIENKINNIIIGKRCKAFNAINKEKIMDIIAELKDSNFTIKNIYNLYNIKYGPNTFSQETLRRYIKKVLKMKYTTVKQRNKNYFTHSNNNIQKIFIKKMIEYIVNDKIIIYIDETTFNNGLFKTKKWVDFNEIKLIPSQPNLKRINLIIAANKEKVISYSIYSNNTTKIEMINFFNKVMDEIRSDSMLKKQFENNNIIFYLDNASYHHSKILIDFFVKNRMRIIYGPPYSPEFNLVELIFSYLKGKYYNSICKTR